MLDSFRKFLLPIVLMAATLPSVGSQRRPAERNPASGRQYLRLDTWARANEFVPRWIERDKTLQLTNRRAQLIFTVNSAEAQVDGVRLWLCFPIALRDGSLCISQLDLGESIGPILFPWSRAGGLKVKTICLDPGHGGSDPGNRVGWHEERKYTLLLAYELRDQLKSAGFKVIMTRDSDKKVELPERAAYANRHNADLFISLHFNSIDSGQNEVEGVETYCLTPAGAYSTNARGEGDTRWVTGNRQGAKSLLLAWEIQNYALKKLNAVDRGVRRARFQVLRETQMPAILIEGGFMSHPRESKKVYDPAYRRQLARAILDGIIAYQKQAVSPLRNAEFHSASSGVRP